jgi:CBS domain containing-hemolysin-like protein
MDSDAIIGLVILAVGILVLITLGAAEAGVIAGVRERALREPAESPVEALRRFYQERQLTLSSLALARNLASVGITAVVVYIVLRHISEDWPTLVLTGVLTALGFMLLQAFPRLLVARDPQRWASRLSPVVVTMRLVFRVPVLLLDAPMGAVMRTWQRYQPGAGAGAEELMLLAEMQDASAALQEQEREMIRGVMELEFTSVREVMIPRPDIVAVDISTKFDDLAQLMAGEGYSRIPVFEGDIDHIRGVAHAKELMRHLTNGKERPLLGEIIRSAHVVPESKKVHELLSEMKRMQISIAIVVDEYGGTAGLVTLEDLVEEIVGEIRDEYDAGEEAVQQINDDEAIVDARVSIDDLNEMFDMSIQKEDFDSVGGFIVNELGRIPSVGDTVRVNGISLKVLSVAGRRIKKVRVVKLPPEVHEPEPGSKNGA